MKTLALMVTIVIEVEDGMAAKFARNPGFLILGDTRLGEGPVKVRLSGEKAVEAMDVRVDVEERLEAVVS